MPNDTYQPAQRCSPYSVPDSPENFHDDVESSSTSYAADSKWKTIGRVELLNNDKDILKSSDRWITDTIINASQHLLKEQFPALSGFQDTIAMENKLVALSNGEFVQVLLKGDSHWITISNIATLDTGAVKIYDSMNDYMVPGSIKKIIARLLMSKKRYILLRHEDVQPQGDFTSCGLFALAFATSLCFGQDPRLAIYTRSLMRQQLLECLENSNMKPFPVEGQRSYVMGRLESFPISCRCRMPDDFGNIEDLLCCHLCSENYHPSCDEDSAMHWKQSDDVQYWLCSECWPLQERQGYICTSAKDKQIV